jgi:hypothetical protein
MIVSLYSLFPISYIHILCKSQSKQHNTPLQNYIILQARKRNCDLYTHREHCNSVAQPNQTTAYTAHINNKCRHLHYTIFTNKASSIGQWQHVESRNAMFWEFKCYSFESITISLLPFFTIT